MFSHPIDEPRRNWRPSTTGLSQRISSKPVGRCPYKLFRSVEPIPRWRPVSSLQQAQGLAAASDPLIAERAIRSHQGRPPTMHPHGSGKQD